MVYYSLIVISNHYLSFRAKSRNLFLIPCLIETLLYDLAGENTLADVDPERGAKGGISLVYKGEANALVKGD